MQKAKSILVKVLVLICVLCCSLSLVFGLTGCAEDGKDGVNGVGIQRVEINSDGKMEITFTNGDTQVVDDQIVSTCKHGTVKKYQMTEGTCVAPAEYITICDVNGGCGWATVTKEPVADAHVVDKDEYDEYLGSYYGTDEHVVLVGENPCAPGSSFQLVCDCGEVLFEQASTAQHVFCEKGADCGHTTCETQVCHACGTANPDYVAVHGEYAWIDVVDPEGNICEDGYHKVYACLDCFANCPDCEDAIMDTEAVEAQGHVIDVDKWSVTTEPTLESAGEYKGYCEFCGTNATIVLPKLSAEDYIKNGEGSGYVQATCAADGTDVYEFEYFGVKLAECKFEVTTTAAHTDRLGNVIDKTEEYNISYLTPENYEGDPIGQVEVDSNATCQVTAQGLLYCRDCDGVVFVTFRGNHEKGEKIEAECVAATCFSNGKDVYSCSREGCETGKFEEVILATGEHDYEYELNTDGETPVLTGVCKTPGCTSTDSKELFWYEFDELEASCKDDGYVKLQYKETEDSEVEEITLSTTPATGHTYNGEAIVSGETYEYSELVAIYGAENIGNVQGKLVVVDIDADFACDEPVTAMAYCEQCSGMVTIQATGDHDWEKTSDADCVNAEVWTCADCGETEERAEALDHQLVYNADLSDTATQKLVFSCEREGCEYSKTVNGVITDEVNTDSTCTVPGTHYVIYKYQDPVTGNWIENQKHTFIEEKPLSQDHHYDDKLIKDLYTWSELVAQFGAENIGKTEGFLVVTAVDDNFDCQNVATAVTMCEDCGGAVFFEASGDHAWSEWEVVNPTCTEDGYRTRHCTIEGCTAEAEVEVDEGSALGHVISAELVQPPTTEAAGKLVITCTDEDCEFSKEITIPMLTAEYVIDSDEATCAAEGYKTYEVTVTDEDVIVRATGEAYTYTYTYTDVLDIIEHQGAEPPVVKTWEHNGYTYTGYWCEDCNQMIVTGKVEA